MKDLTSYKLKDAQDLVNNWVKEYEIDLSLDSDDVLAIRIYNLILKFKKEFSKYENTLIKDHIVNRQQLMETFNKQ